MAIRLHLYAHLLGSQAFPAVKMNFADILSGAHCGMHIVESLWLCASVGIDSAVVHSLKGEPNSQSNAVHHCAQHKQRV